MKKLLQMKFMLLLCALIVGSGTAWADYVLVTSTDQLVAGKNYLIVNRYKTKKMEDPAWYSFGSFNSNNSYNSTAITVSGDIGDTDLSVTDVKSAHILTLGGSTGQWTLYDNSENKYVALTANSNRIDQAANATENTAKWTIAINSNNEVTISNVSFTSRSIRGNQGSSKFACYAGPQSANVEYLFVEESSATNAPSISAPDVDIDYDATDGSIAYTISNGVEGGSVSVSKDGDWITLSEGTASPISFTCSANSETTARTATVTLTYTYNTTETVTKDVTITQDAAPVVYTTIPALFAAATSTETEVKVTFNNWVVSGVSTNGKNVFVTDNSGNGFMIYSSSNQSSTYSVGDILSGTAVSCSLVLYSGYAEITDLDASDLTITSGGTVSVFNIAMADLAGVNTGALVSYNGLTCSIDNNKYYLTDGTTTIQLHNSLYAYEALEAGEKYNITGIYQQYNSTKEILPRSANDIVKVDVPKHTLLVVAENGSVQIAGQTLDEDGECEIKEGASVTATATPAEHYTFTSWTVSGFTLEDATANPLTFTMPTNDATLAATFTEDLKHTATFYVQGEEDSSEEVYVGDAITFPSVTAPTGYTFMGWTTNEIPATQATAPADLVTSANMGTSDVKYYAVFAVVSGTPATLTKMMKGDTFSADDNVVIVANVDDETAYALYQETQSNSYVKYYSFTADAETIGADDKNWLTVSAGSDGKWKLGDATNGYLYTSGSNNLSIDKDNSTDWTLEDNNDGTFKLKGGSNSRYVSCRSDLTGTNQYLFRMAGGTPAGVYSFDIYKYVAGSATYSDYCTTIPEALTVNIKEACTDGKGKYYGTFSSSSAFVVPENLTVSEIGIDAEGKMVVSNYDSGDIVPANTGVMVSAETFGNFKLVKSTEDGVDILNGANRLRPTGDNGLAATEMNSAEPETCKFYRLTMHGAAENNPGKIGFWWGADGGDSFAIAANKAYLAVPASVAGTRNGFAFGDDATGINNVNVNENVNGSVFDLQGRKVSTPGKGLYIVNGKKVVIK